MQSASSDTIKAQQQLARVRDILSKSRETLDYKIESAQVDFTEKVLSAMDEKGISEAAKVEEFVIKLISARKEKGTTDQQTPVDPPAPTNPGS